MTNKGKHASRSPGTFYRDLVIMILGILVVGALVFLILYLIAESPDTGPSTTTTTQVTTTTSPDDVSTPEGQDTTSTTTVTTTTVPVRPPGEVTVIVLNSVGLDGAAGRLTSDLDAAGYQTITPDNYQPEQTPSRIWFREGFAPEASVLLEFVPGAVVEALPDDTVGEGADVVIVLGTGYEE
jgi:cytoskeletal protein RodZ